MHEIAFHQFPAHTEYIHALERILTVSLQWVAHAVSNNISLETQRSKNCNPFLWTDYFREPICQLLEHMAIFKISVSASKLFID